MVWTTERPAWSGNSVANEAMSRYAAGDDAAFPILYDATVARLDGFVRRRINDASRVDDLVQQTFERMHRARGTFIRGSDVLSWAFKIARNLCVDLGTRGWRERPSTSSGSGGGDDPFDPVSAAVGEVVDAERVATARETLGRVVRVFRTLPVGQQLALELVRVEGFSLAAAAENLGVSVASVKMSVFRGAATLRAAARDGENDAPDMRTEARADAGGGGGGEVTAEDKEQLRGVI